MGPELVENLRQFQPIRKKAPGCPASSGMNWNGDQYG